MSGYQLGIDLGTSCSAAAVCRTGDRAEPIGPPVPSVVFGGADGSFLIGADAQARALAQPSRVLDGFVRRVGDPTPVLLGREPVAGEVLAARFVGGIVDLAAAQEGAPPAGITLAHPTGWGRHRVESLRAALPGRATMLPQAVAAVLGHGRDLQPGALVAVHDLGGATFDAAVVRVVDGGAELAAPAETIERLGGDDLDEAVFAHVRAALGSAWAELDGTDGRVQAAVVGLRRDCTAAKERLSSDTETVIAVRLPGCAPTEVRLTRAELEEGIRAGVLETVEVFGRALDAAGVAPGDLAEVLLVGGSARIPLVAQLMSAGIGRAVTVADDPKGVFAAGAALWAARRARPAPAVPVGVAVGSSAIGAANTGPELVVGEPGAGTATDVLADGPDATARTAADEPEPDDERNPLALARPPKQSSPFPTAAVEAKESKAPLFIALGLLVLTILGALVVVGASRYAARNEAVATTPAVVTPAGQQAPTAVLPRVAPPPPAPQRRTPVTAPPTTTAAPAPTTTRPPATAPPTVPPTTTAANDGDEPPADDPGDQPDDQGDQSDGAPPAQNGAADGPGARQTGASSTPPAA